MVKLNNLLVSLKEKGNWKILIFHSSWTLTFTAAVSYFFGFLRDRLFAQTFGLSRTLDIYNAAFVIPDLMLNVLIGTALSAAFLPIFSKQFDEKKELGYRYVHQMMSWGLLLITVLGVIAAIALPYFAHKLVPGFEGEDLKQYILLSRILMLSPLLFTLSNLYGRMLLSFKEFIWYGISPAFYNMGIILGVVLLVPKFGILGLAMGTILGIFFHLFIRLFRIRRTKHAFRHQFNLTFSAEIKETIKLMLPKMFQYFIWSFMLLSFTSIASELAEGSIATYNYARNFQSLPVSMLGIAIALSMYTSLSHDAGKRNFSKFKKDFRRDRLRSLFYTTFAAMGLAILAKPIVSLLLGGGAFDEKAIHLLSRTLQIYCIAVPLESLLHIYHRAYYSLRNTIVPATFHGLTMLGAIQLAKYLAPHIGVIAIPIGFAVGLAVHVSILATLFPMLLRNREKDLN